MVLIIEGIVIGFFIALPLGMWIGGRNVQLICDALHKPLKK